MAKWGMLVDFRLLGPLELIHERSLVNLEGARQQSAVAALLLDANKVVSTDRLIDVIWGESAPSTARNQVQICMSTVRRVLARAGAGGMLRTQAPGYLLEVDDDAFDLARFRAEVTEGRDAAADGHTEDAVRVLRHALGMWRGPALAGIRSDLLDSAAMRLDEVRLDVLEEVLELELGVGRHPALVPELRSLVVAHPLRERLRAHLMVALYRCGRQSEALAEFRDIRRTLVDELGIEPSSELANLEAAVLDHSADLDWRPSSGTVAAVALPVQLLPPDIADFTGRSRAVECLSDALTTRVPGRPPPLVLLTGLGGVGKSSTAVHIGHLLTGVNAFPDGQLYADLHGGTTPTEPGHVLERFLRTLGVPPAAIPDDCEQRAEVFRALLADRTVLIVLDDAFSELQITPLLPGSGSSAVLVTSRHRLTGIPMTYRYELDVMSRDTAVTLVRAGIGERRVEAEPQAARQLIELCGRLPLAIRIAAAKLSARPHWTLARMVGRLQDEAHRLDELSYAHLGVRMSMSITYDGLSPDAQRLFRLLGLLRFPDLPAWVATALLDVAAERAEDLLDELAEAHVIEVSLTGAGSTFTEARYRTHDLVHALARERLAAEVGEPERLAAIERVLGSVLVLADEAHCLEYGGDFLSIHGGASRYTIAPSVVEEIFDGDPLAWLERERPLIASAVSLAVLVGLTTHAWEVALRAVTLYEARGLLDDWESSHQVALEGSRRAADLLGEAAMEYSLGSLAMFRQDRDAALAQLGSALGRFNHLKHQHGAALVLRNLAHLDRVGGRVADAIARGEQAMGEFLGTGDFGAQVHVMRTLALTRLDAGETRSAISCLLDALRIADRAGLRRLRWQVLFSLAEAQLAADLAHEAEGSFSEVLDAVTIGRDELGRAYALLGLGQAQSALDRNETGLTLRQAERLAAELDDVLLQARITLALAQFHQNRGQRNVARSLAQRAYDDFERLGAPVWSGRAALLLEEIPFWPDAVE